MKTRMAAVLFMLLIGAPVQAQEPFDEYPYYVNLRLGGAFGEAMQGVDAASGFDADFDTGLLVSSGFGYRFHPNFRLEAEFANRTNEVVDIIDCTFICFGPLTTGNAGELSTTSYMQCLL